MDAILKETKQFYDRDVMCPLLPTEITENVKAKALGYLIFLNEKRNGEIKGRGYADGRPQNFISPKRKPAHQQHLQNRYLLLL